MRRVLLLAVPALLLAAGVAYAAAEKKKQPRFELIVARQPGPALQRRRRRPPRPRLPFELGRPRLPLARRAGLQPRERAPAAARLDLRRRRLAAAPGRDVDGEDDRAQRRHALVQGRPGGHERAGLPRRTPSQGFALYDVSNPAQPRELAVVETAPRGSHEIWLQRVGGRAYVWTAIPGSERSSAPNAQTPGPARLPHLRRLRSARAAARRRVGRVGGARPQARRPRAGGASSTGTSSTRSRATRPARAHTCPTGTSAR